MRGLASTITLQPIMYFPSPVGATLYRCSQSLNYIANALTTFHLNIKGPVTLQAACTHCWKLHCYYSTAIIHNWIVWKIQLQ